MAKGKQPMAPMLRRAPGAGAVVHSSPLTESPSVPEHVDSEQSREGDGRVAAPVQPVLPPIQTASPSSTHSEIPPVAPAETAAPRKESTSAASRPRRKANGNGPAASASASAVAPAESPEGRRAVSGATATASTSKGEAPQLPKAPPAAYSDRRPKVPINVDLDPRDANKIRTVAKVDGRSLPDVLGEAIRFYYAWKEWERGETYKETVTRLKPGRPVQINEALLTEEE